MTLEEAAVALDTFVKRRSAHCDFAGVGGTDDKPLLIVYARSSRTWQAHDDELSWMGYRVIVQRVGIVRAQAALI